MESRYSDLVNRLLGIGEEDLFKKLTPSEPVGGYGGKIHRIRDASDADISGGLEMTPAFPLVRAGLFYAYDALEDAHRIVQEASGDLSAYWHGMLHRREADFDNARHWFRRAGTLPHFAKAHNLASEFSPEMARQMSWDPYLFTGLCEQSKYGDETLSKTLIRLQRVEFEVTFNYTWRQGLKQRA
jgi:hypothetical protein